MIVKEKCIGILRHHSTSTGCPLVLLIALEIPMCYTRLKGILTRSFQCVLFSSQDSTVYHYNRIVT